MSDEHRGILSRHTAELQEQDRVLRTAPYNFPGEAFPEEPWWTERNQRALYLRILLRGEQEQPK